MWTIWLWISRWRLGSFEKCIWKKMKKQTCDCWCFRTIHLVFRIDNLRLTMNILSISCRNFSTLSISMRFQLTKQKYRSRTEKKKNSETYASVELGFGAVYRNTETKKKNLLIFWSECARDTNYATIHWLRNDELNEVGYFGKEFTKWLTTPCRQCEIWIHEPQVRRWIVRCLDFVFWVFVFVFLGWVHALNMRLKIPGEWMHRPLNRSICL